jgi:hypothetical protein
MLARIRCGASSRANRRASIARPAFVVEYAVISGHGTAPIQEPVKSCSPGWHVA